jgi:hypothetical protein
MPFAEQGRNRTDKGEFWWELRACDYYSEFEKPKIVYPNILKGPEFTYESGPLYTNQKCFIISLEDKYLLGVLNSKISAFLFESVLPKLRGNFYEPSYKYFKDFPIPSAPQEVRKRIAFLTDQILEFKNNSKAKTAKFKKGIDKLEEEVDNLVYGLYNLNAEEIQLVEKSDIIKSISLPISSSMVTSNVAEDEL